jgi:hypothetical protein
MGSLVSGLSLWPAMLFAFAYALHFFTNSALAGALIDMK